VRALSGGHRVIVPDHIGMGLSDKPSDGEYEYSLARRVADFGALIEHARIEGPLDLVVHDWGGMIGLAWAVEHAHRVRRLVLLNTAAFHLPPDKPMPWQLSLARDSRLGALLVRGVNAFSFGATHLAVKRPLPPAVRAAYRAPYDSWANRIATLRFVQDIPLAPGDRSYDLVSRTASKLRETFARTPVLVCWGLGDFVFDAKFLDEWRAYLPHAEVHAYPDAGHYVLEDAAEDVIPRVRAFLDGA
jgi:pimeloyl-ACP methyl ester carboxylesterase